MTLMDWIVLAVIVSALAGLVPIALAFLGLVLWPFRRFAEWLFGKK